MRFAPAVSFALAPALALALAACASTSASGKRYDWGSYDTALYGVYTDPGSAGASIDKLQAHVTGLEQAGRKVPPGLYADLGTLWLQAGAADKAQACFARERALWPESATLMDALSGRDPAPPQPAGALRSILVVPAVNRSANPSAAESVVPALSAVLAQKGYYVFPVHTVRLVLEQKGMRGGEQVQGRPAAELATLFGADAVLLVSINDWKRPSLGPVAKIAVDVDYRLVDRNGKEIWKTRENMEWTPPMAMDKNYQTPGGDEVRSFGRTAMMPAKAAASPILLARTLNARALLSAQTAIADGPYGAGE